MMRTEQKEPRAGVDGSNRVEEAILGGIRRGDESAFEELTRRFGPGLKSFAGRLCGNLHDADDLYQETLLTAYEKIGGLQNPGAMRSWLFRVAHRGFLMRLRRQRRLREVPLDDTHSEVIGERRFPGKAPGQFEHPQRAIELAEIRDALEQGISQLPPEYGKVIVLRDMEGLSTSETAKSLRISIGAVKMRLHRARTTARGHLQEFAVA